MRMRVCEDACVCVRTCVCVVLVVTHLDVGCVEVPQGGKSSRQAVGTGTDPQGLQDAGGHTRPLTETLRGERAGFID